MRDRVSEANGYAHAYSTWISRGNGLDTKRDGVFRYKSGPMKGMTRDQAQMKFQNEVWKNATPEWKNEYAKRATSDLLAPREQSDLEKRKALAAGVSEHQYRTQQAQPTTDNGQVALLPAVYGGGRPTPVQTPTVPPLQTAPPAAVSPPKYQANKAAAQQRNAKRVAQTVEKMGQEPYGDNPAGRFDLMKADYSTLTPKQKAQRTQVNVDRHKEQEPSREMPPMTVTAPRMKPLETKYEVGRGVVQTGGDADQAFLDYKEAQKAAHAGTATAQQRQTVMDYVGQDVIGRQPGQIAKQREDERKGYYQAGRYVGPPQPAAPRIRVAAPVFPGGMKRSNPAPVATRQPSFGNRAGTGATRMPI